MNEKNMQQPGTPDPDSHFRLLPCPECGGTEIEYLRRVPHYRLEWCVRCKTCGKMSRYWTVKHHAQIEWNGKERPSWERD